jgi:hypothetical protein
VTNDPRDIDGTLFFGAGARELLIDPRVQRLTIAWLPRKEHDHRKYSSLKSALQDLSFKNRLTIIDTPEGICIECPADATDPDGLITAIRERTGMHLTKQEDPNGRKRSTVITNVR